MGCNVEGPFSFFSFFFPLLFPDSSCLEISWHLLRQNLSPSLLFPSFQPELGPPRGHETSVSLSPTWHAHPTSSPVPDTRVLPWIPLEITMDSAAALSHFLCFQWLCLKCRFINVLCQNHLGYLKYGTLSLLQACWIRTWRSVSARLPGDSHAH